MAKPVPKPTTTPDGRIILPVEVVRSGPELSDILDVLLRIEEQNKILINALTERPR